MKQSIKVINPTIGVQQVHASLLKSVSIPPWLLIKSMCVNRVELFQSNVNNPLALDQLYVCELVELFQSNVNIHLALDQLYVSEYGRAVPISAETPLALDQL